MSVTKSLSLFNSLSSHSVLCNMDNASWWFANDKWFFREVKVETDALEGIGREYRKKTDRNWRRKEVGYLSKRKYWRCHPVILKRRLIFWDDRNRSAGLLGYKTFLSLIFKPQVNFKWSIKLLSTQKNTRTDLCLIHNWHKVIILAKL